MQRKDLGPFPRSDVHLGQENDKKYSRSALRYAYLQRQPVGHLSLFLYPWHQLQHDARDGELFVCHLAREAKPLSDPDKYLVKLQSVLQFRSSYQCEIDQAVEFGMYLARFGDELNSALLINRALWCIRTILIARSAERREPVLALQRLAENTESAAARDVLKPACPSRKRDGLTTSEYLSERRDKV
jgi:hypothetical protein